MQQLIKQLEQIATDTNFSGVISIHGDSAKAFQKGYGYRDINNSLLNDPETLFGIASGTKLFTAIGIGVLAEQGKIKLDTQVGEIDLRYAGFIDERVTIHQLLTHTSGIYDYYDEEIITDFDNYHLEIPWFELETPSDYWPLFESKKAKFNPGERYSYSNGGYVFLAIMIEKLSGLLYRDFVTQDVLRPSGMERSGFFAFNDLPENTSNGYFKDRRTTNIYQLPLRGGGDGGMYTTADDLQRFWNALFNYTLLSKQLTETFLNTQWKFDDRTGYGCGIYKRLDDSMFYIVGGDGGVEFASRYRVGDRVTISVLSNITDGENMLGKAVSDYLFKDTSDIG